MSRTDLVNGVYKEYPLDNSTEGYAVGHVKPPYGTVTKLEYHQPQGEGDAHYVDVYFDDNKLPTERIFRPDSISWQPAPKHDSLKYHMARFGMDPDNMTAAEVAAHMRKVSDSDMAILEAHKYDSIKAAFKQALGRIREVAWGHDIPSPSCPEYREMHEALTEVMEAIDKEIAAL